MLDNDRILNNIYGDTMYGKIDWYITKETKFVIHWTTIKRLTNKKYISLVLIHHKRQNKIIFFIKIITRKSTDEILKLFSGNYSILYDILYNITDLNYE